MLSHEIDIFEIQLDNPTASYTPGDTISGKLILVLNSRKSLRALKLRFKGECKISWCISESDYRHGKEKYFGTELCLVGDADGDTIQMEPGHYIFPFSYSLPRNIPGSYKHHVGKISYSIEGIFDRAWRIDDRIKRIITVEAALEWEPLEQKEKKKIDHEIVKSFCCGVMPCINVGKMLVRIRVPNTIFECGDRIEATININNKSHINVTKIIFRLEEVLDFHSTSPKDTKNEIKTIQKVEKRGPFSASTEVKLGLQVPQLPFSLFKYCKLIDLNYRLNISVHYSGCHCATKSTHSILIGSRSPMPTIAYQELSTSPMTNYSTHTAPQISIDKHFSETELSSRIPIEYVNRPYPPSMFAGSYPHKYVEPQDIGLVCSHQLSNQNNWDEVSPPPYDVMVVHNGGKFQS